MFGKKAMVMIATSVMIVGSSASSLAQTDGTGFTQDLPSLSTGNIDQSLIDGFDTSIATPEVECQDFSEDILRMSPRPTKSNITLQARLALNNLDSAVTKVFVGCIADRPAGLPTNMSSLASMGQIFNYGGYGYAMCPAGDLRAMTVQIPMFISETATFNSPDRYHCAIWLQTEDAPAQQPGDSVQAPLWAMAKQGSELVGRISGPWPQ